MLLEEAVLLATLRQVGCGDALYVCMYEHSISPCIYSTSLNMSLAASHGCDAADRHGFCTLGSSVESRERGSCRSGKGRARRLAVCTAGNSQGRRLYVPAVGAVGTGADLVSAKRWGMANDKFNMDPGRAREPVSVEDDSKPNLLSGTSTPPGRDDV